MRVTGELYAAPLGSDNWQRLGISSTEFRGVPTTTDVSNDEPLTFKPLRIEMGWVISGREFHALRRLFLRVAGPRPLAPGCLAVSKVGRRGWR